MLCEGWTFLAIVGMEKPNFKNRWRVKKGPSIVVKGRYVVKKIEMQKWVRV